MGASESPVKIGGRRWLSMLSSGFSGGLYPVHPTRATISEIPTVKSVDGIEGVVDLVVIAIPPQAVSDVANACIKKRVAGVVVITGGFGEQSQAGRDLEQDLARRFAEAGIRMIGPNCAGIFSDVGAVNATGMALPKGPIGLITQSGNILLDLAHRARASHVGFSCAISTGNGVDVRPPELLEYLLEDDSTKVIIVYVEGWVENEARCFCDIAERGRDRKPIIVVKPGETEAGMRAVMSHTGSLAGEMRIVDSVFEQVGIIKAASIDEAWELGLALCRTPPLTNSAIVVASDGGGHATLACDALGLAGLELAPLSVGVKDALRALLPERCPISNPVDYAGYAEEVPSVVPASLDACLKAPEVGGALLAGHFGGYHHLAGETVRDPELTAARELGATMRRYGKPIVVHSVYAHDDEKAIDAMRAEGISVVRTLPEAAAIFRGLARFGNAAAAKRLIPIGLSGQVPDLSDILGRATPEGILLEPDARDAMNRYGLPIAVGITVASKPACLVAVKQLGCPVALKVVSPKIVHKSEAGGVALNVDLSTCEAAFDRLGSIGRSAGDPECRVLVSPMLARGLELVIGGFRDTNFGPVVMVGIGGVLVEALDDVAFGRAPLSLPDAEQMLNSLKLKSLLDGYRGQSRVDHRALTEALIRLSHMLVNEPAIAEVDANPMIANDDGLHIVDARIILKSQNPALGLRA